MEKGRLIFTFAVFLIFASLLKATDISGCALLDNASDTYYLTADIVNASIGQNSICMYVGANDVTLDCQGHLIDAADPYVASYVIHCGGAYGVLAGSIYYHYTGTTIKNCIVSDWCDAEISTSPSSVSTILNSTADISLPESLDLSVQGFSIGGSSNLIANNSGPISAGASSSNFTGNTGSSIALSGNDNLIENNSLVGLYYPYSAFSLSGSNNTIRNNNIYGGWSFVLPFITINSNNEHIYNNIFNGSLTSISAVNPSGWNTTNQSGDNIWNASLGYIGGNLWTDPYLNGYSNTCTDAGYDGYCDLPYDVLNKRACVAGVNCSNDTDYLPYLGEPAPPSPPPLEANCANITTSGGYIMTNDTNYYGDGAACIEIQANDVLLDCQGFTINGNNYGGYGIQIARSSENATHVTIQNCHITGFDANIYIENSTNNFISNTELSDAAGYYGSGILLIGSSHNMLAGLTATNGTHGGGGASGLDIIDSNFNLVYNFSYDSNNPDGIYLQNSNFTTIWDGSADSNTNCGIDLASSYNNEIFNVSVTDNGIGICLDTSASNNFTMVNASANGDGFTLGYSDANTIQFSTIANNFYEGIYTYDSTNNSIFNNLLNNSPNVVLDTDVYDGFWNTTQQFGTRIYGSGWWIGGNYWANPSGNDYSDNCTDANHDGFCDSPYDIYNNGACIAGINCSGNTDFLPLGGNFTGCGFRSLSITTWDELTDQQIYFDAYITNGTATMTILNAWSFNETDCNASLPTGNVSVAISNSSYYGPRYYFGYIGNAVLKAYLLPLNDSHAVLATFMVQDAGTSPAAGIQNAEVDVYKDYSGILVLIAQRMTDSIGGATVYLNSQTQYVANASAVGYIPKTVAASFANSTTIYIPLNRIAYSIGFGAMFSDINYTLLPVDHWVYNYSHINASFLFSVSSKNGTLSWYGMNITNASGNLLFTGSGSNAYGGSIPASINASQHSGYFNVTFWIYSPTFSSDVYAQTVRYIIYPASNQTNLGGIMGAGGLLANSGLGKLAIGLLAIILSLLISGAFTMGGFSIGQSGLLFTIVFSGFSAVEIAMGIFTPGLWIGTILIQVSFIILRWL